ncbi:MAG: LTA synthase family protein [Mogibacterium sp.]|nr:LTA synthase family protein [Mogibacterium sp.]
MVIFRDSPLIATDIAQWETGLQVVKSYEITWDKSSIWAILITVLWCVAAFSLGGHKGLPARKRLIPLAASIICAGSCYYAIFRSSLIQDMDIHVSGFRPKASYQYNGSALSFAVTAKNAHVVKPSGYDPEVVANIAKTYTSDEAVPATKVSKKTPNVIVIMNESFADMTSVGEFATNEDFMPYFRSLKENTIHGWMQSSVFGGSTADSEFECLTGFSMNYLPFHSVPYRSVINEEIPSLAYYFKQLGYGGITAFHPGMRDSYRRDVVYPLIGFDKHIAFDDLENPEQIRDFVSDACDYQELEKEFEQFRSSSGDQPFFMFNVTIQNHGGYAFNTGIVDHGITITDEQYNEESGLQFINLMKYSDEALKDLLDYFSNVDEETVIVLFGDHQPKLEPEFYSRLKTQHPGISALEWATLKHQVPFMIWANYDIEEQDDLRISANYIAPYLKSVIGLPMTGFDKYLMDLHTQLPKISAISYQDAAGGIYDPAEPSQYDEKLNEYGIIQYNGLIDKKNRVEDFFRLK